MDELLKAIKEATEQEAKANSQYIEAAHKAADANEVASARRTEMYRARDRTWAAYNALRAKLGAEPHQIP